MKRSVSVLPWLAVLAVASIAALLTLDAPEASAQSSLTAGASEAPRFEAADIRTSAHVTNPYMRGGVLRGGRWDVRTASMLELISTAYSI